MLNKIYKIVRLVINNRYLNNNWISMDTPPKRSYLGNFLIIVKTSESRTFRYEIWMSSYSNFAIAGESFDCWRKSTDGNYISASPIARDKVLYWRPLPKLPESIRRYSTEGYYEDPTEIQ